MSNQLHTWLRGQQPFFESFARCWRCQRKLTSPASVERGLGPRCAVKETQEQEEPKHGDSDEAKEV